MPAYEVALLDWLACAAGGVGEPAARAAAGIADGLAGRVAALGTAGHVLDFDDTYAPGLAHLSAPTAPAALVLGAERGATIGAVLDAYAAGFEAMGALARASHPALYDGGWHPTSVCGPVGGAVAAARLLALDEAATRTAVALALIRTGGMRAAFGSDAKALQVGRAAAAGVEAALLAQGGAWANLDRVAGAHAGFEEAFGGRYAEPKPSVAAIDRNWIKAYPCCLQTHSAIECALALREAGIPGGDIDVVVHPVSLRAAAIQHPADGLEAKFSIPYLTAFALLHGAPAVEDFVTVEPGAAALARERVRVRLDDGMGESAAAVEAGGRRLAHVGAALGSPGRPLDERALAQKVQWLAGPALAGALEDLERPAASVLVAAGLASVAP